MASNMIGVAGKSEILSGLYAVDGIDRSGQSHSSGFPVIGKRGGFTGFEIASDGRRGRSLTVSARQDEQDNNKDFPERNYVVNRSLRLRRIYPLQGLICPYLFHPFLFRPLKLQRRCWPNSCSTHRPPLSNHYPRLRLTGNLVVFGQNGRIAKGAPPVSRRRRPLKATKKSPVKKTVRKENARQVGHNMIIGDKAIFPDSDLVFFQLCLDYYADYRKNTNHPARQGLPSRYDPLQRPSCGDHAMTLYGEYNQNRVMDCPVGCPCRCCSEGAGRHCRSPGKYPCFFNGAYSFGKDRNSVFVMGRKFRFGLWNIKLLTALLIFFLLITVLEGITGIRGSVSVASLSALELLSGLIIALGMMAMALLVLCVLMKR